MALPELRRGQPGLISRGTPLADRIIILGYQLKDVAAGTGIDRWRLNDYLNRRKPIPPHHLYRLARFLDCSPEALR